MSALTIPQKMSNSGSIHDIASDQFDRRIVFGKGCKYAVILASYYGGKGYTTHKTEAAAVRAYRATKGSSSTQPMLCAQQRAVQGIVNLQRHLFRR